MAKSIVTRVSNWNLGTTCLTVDFFLEDCLNNYLNEVGSIRKVSVGRVPEMHFMARSRGIALWVLLQQTSEIALIALFKPLSR